MRTCIYTTKPSKKTYKVARPGQAHHSVLAAANNLDVNAQNFDFDPFD